MGFQPGIAIFVGKEGQAVYEHFTSLVSHIHRPLCHGIGLLRLTSSEQPALIGLLASEIRDLNDQTQTPAPNSSDFLTALTTLQARLRSDAEMRCYRSYLTQERRPLQIYIAGSPSQETCELASHIRREQADQVEISYLFCCTPCFSRQELVAESHEFVTWVQANTIRFSYFYGDLTTEAQQQYPTENFIYAAALALFALLTTDLSNHTHFHQAGAKPGEDARVPARYGTLSACLISSLHHAIRQAYAAKVGVLLLEDWQQELSAASAHPELQRKIDRTLTDIPLAWLSPKPGELIGAHKKKRQKITLEDLVPGPQTVIIPGAPEQHTAYARLYTTVARQTQRLHRSRNFLPGRAPASHLQDTWRDAFLSLWQHLREEYIKSAVLHLENMWQAYDLSGTIALATRLDEELETIIQQLQVVWKDKEPEAVSGEQNIPGTQSSQVTHSDGQPADWQVRQRPDRLRLSLVCLTMGLLLSFVAWLLCNELGLTQGLLLPLLVASCFGGVFATNWLYLRHTYPLPTSQARKREDSSPQRAWMQRCLQVSYQQRLALATQLQTHLRCFTSTFLAQAGQKLARRAEQSLEHPFLIQSSGRNFLCGNGHHLLTAFEASLDFLDQPSRGGRFIFNNLKHSRSKDSEKTERESLSEACKEIVHTFVSPRSPGADEQVLLEALYHEIRTQIDPWFRAEQAENTSLLAETRTDRSVTNYLSRNEFELETSPELLEKALSRAQLPTLWQGQRERAAPTNFFCTTQRRIEENRAKFRQPLAEIKTTVAQERGAPSELTSRWILLCALYREDA